MRCCSTRMSPFWCWIVLKSKREKTSIWFKTNRSKRSCTREYVDQERPPLRSCPFLVDRVFCWSPFLCSWFPIQMSDLWGIDRCSWWVRSSSLSNCAVTSSGAFLMNKSVNLPIQGMILWKGAISRHNLQPVVLAEPDLCEPSESPSFNRCRSASRVRFVGNLWSSELRSQWGQLAASRD